MRTYTQIIYQVVFGTKRREKTLWKENRDELYKYIGGLLVNKKCTPVMIGGVEDHLHIVMDLHPTVALASIVKDIKLASSDYIKRNKLFPHFCGWQEGYGAFTYSVKERQALINYVANQEIHHGETTFLEEYFEFLKEADIEYDERYM
jgi:REP element-mobilizing transposase RayT